MALQAAELRSVLIEHGVAEAAAVRIVALAEQSVADERQRVDGEFAVRDATLQQIAERLERLAELQEQLAREFHQFRLEQERSRSDMARTEFEGKADRERIEREAKADRERIKREAKAERGAMEARLKIDLRNQILIGTGLVLGGLAVATGVILGVLG